MSEEAKKERKQKTVVPYVVGVWADGKFVPCDEQPAAAVTEFSEIVKWAIAKFGKHPGKYSFVRKDPRTLSIVEQTTVKGTLV